MITYHLVNNIGKDLKIFYSQQVQMNEGKEKLDAMRKNLKKKANHIPPSINNTEIVEDIKQPQQQSSVNKKPIEQKFEKKEKEGQNINKSLNINPSYTEAQINQQKQNKILTEHAKKLDEQGLQEGQIQEEQNQLAEEKQDLSYPQPIRNLNSNVNSSQNQEKPQKSNIINLSQNQKHKEDPQQLRNMDLQRQVVQENQNKNENNSQHNSDKIIEQKSNQPLQMHPINKISKNSDKLQQKLGSFEQKIIESEEKQNLGEINSNANKNDQNLETNVQKQQTQKVESNVSVNSTQNFNLQSTLSYQNNSIHKSEGRANHQSGKPAIKVVLKQLQMIKSTIHNLNVTYRGVEYLREKIKKDSVLKRKIRERLIDLQGDNDMDVLRKLVKQVQSSCQRNSEIPQKSSSATAPNKHHHLWHDKHASHSHMANNKQALVSQKMISQPQISLSNEVIEY